MHLEKLENFLKTVNLQNCRRRFLPIKIVEMDMPKEIQALNLLYKVYWDEKRFIPFEEFYSEYARAYRRFLREFQIKTQMCLRCFRKGLPARIYRTWASIITQIHAGYVAESVFGVGCVSMSEELDHNGADFRIEYRGHMINYQVKKETFSREVRAEKKTKKLLPGEFIQITYKVPDFDMILNPRKRNGDFKKAFKDFKEIWLDTNKIKILDNGFVVFTPQVFIEKKKEIDEKIKMGS